MFSSEVDFCINSTLGVEYSVSLIFFNWFSDSSADCVSKTVSKMVFHHVTHFSKPYRVTCLW